MLAPIVPLSITGAVWYQGESHEKLAAPYYTLLPAMISDWRRLFGQGDFPFYIVGLPVYRPHSDVPVDDGWTGVREAQSLAAKSVPHSCLAVTVDTGNPDNVHPIDKKDPGERLALCALGEHYGQKVVYSGPTLKSVDRLSGAIRLRFDHVEGGLVAKGGEPGEFSIAGEDRKWYWANARIEGDTIIVSSGSVPNPTRSAMRGRRIRRQRCLMERVCLHRYSVPTTGPVSCRTYGDCGVVIAPCIRSSQASVFSGCLIYEVAQNFAPLGYSRTHVPTLLAYSKAGLTAKPDMVPALRLPSPDSPFRLAESNRE